MKSKQIKTQGPRFISVPAAAEYLGISAKTLYNRTHRKADNPFPVKVKKIGSRSLFDFQELEKFVASL